MSPSTISSLSTTKQLDPSIKSPMQMAWVDIVFLKSILWRCLSPSQSC